MNRQKELFAEQYRDMDTDELLELHARGTLIDTAREAIEDELSNRAVLISQIPHLAEGPISPKQKQHFDLLFFVRWALVVIFAIPGLVRLKGTMILGLYDPIWEELAFPIIQILASVTLALRHRSSVFLLLICLIRNVYLGFTLHLAFILVPFDLAAIALAVHDWKTHRTYLGTPITVSPPHKVWRIYFYLLVVFFLIGVPTLIQLSGNNWFVFLPSAAFAMVGLLGLWGYIHSQSVGGHWMWELYLPIQIAKDLFVAFLYVNSLIADPALDSERAFAILGLVTISLAVPLYIALWRYTYRLPSIWHKS